MCHLTRHELMMLEEYDCVQLINIVSVNEQHDPTRLLFQLETFYCQLQSVCVLFDEVVKVIE